MSNPSTAIAPGGLALADPVTFIWSWTGCPTAVLELLKTAVTSALAATRE
jgi:hypothetical protein